ncbi:unnamed protein product [Caenorhabditis sp. 36 PRJEB53466]|nr:unnamed protein product [Caenorhabditis sp. 36 PRJEB53466]
MTTLWPILLVFLLRITVNGVPVKVSGPDGKNEKILELLPLAPQNGTLQVENTVHIHHPRSTSASPPHPSESPEDVLLKRLTPIELKFWKKLKHSVGKVLENAGEKAMGDLLGKIAG